MFTGPTIVTNAIATAAAVQAEKEAQQRKAFWTAVAVIGLGIVALRWTSKGQ